MHKKSFKTFLICFILITSFLPIRNVKATGSEQSTSGVETVLLNHYAGNDNFNFDDNWKFNFGDANGANAINFQDSSWQSVNLPHDFSLTQNYSPNAEGESGFKLGGIGWYRKSFTVDSSYKNKNIFINFDGSYMQTTVYLNGKKLAFQPYGYAPFTVDLTDDINFEGNNVLAVKVNHQFPSSRWYSGSGLYRSVHLSVKEKTHFEEYGIKITNENLKTQFNSDEGVDVKVGVKKINPENKSLAFGVKVYKGTNIVAESEKSSTDSLEFKVIKPALWSFDNPNLYRFEVSLYDGDTVVDVENINYGFRFTDFDYNNGFSINGKLIKLKGVSMHHDQGSLGAKAYEDAIRRQLTVLKQMGVNSIRVTHNPAARVLIDLSNEMGMLLIDEAYDTWQVIKNYNPNDFSKWFDKTIGDGQEKLLHSSPNETWGDFEMRQMVRRGLNDPSIIMWSTGNEIHEISDYSAQANAKRSRYGNVIVNLANVADEIDGTRPITIGDNKIKSNDSWAVNMVQALWNRESKVKPVIGINYANEARNGQYSMLHRKGWTTYASETASAINSRGVYNVKGNSQRRDKQLTSYDQSTVAWGNLASQAWYDVARLDYVAGTYVWTGFDYLGEPTPWNQIQPSPSSFTSNSPKSSYFGIVDLAGFPKDSFYFYQSQWNDDVHTLHVLPAWSSQDVSKNYSNEVEVVVYTDASSVELFFTDKNGNKTSLGKKNFITKTTNAGYKYRVLEDDDSFRGMYATWMVPYADGTIEAVGYDDAGNVINNTEGVSSRTTYGSAAKLNGTVKDSIKNSVTADNKSLIYYEIDIQDNEGNFVNNANNVITFNVEGAGELIAVDNGDATDHQPYSDNNRKAFSGKALAIVKSTDKAGSIKITASSPGLTPSSITIESKALNDTTKVYPTSYEITKNIYLKKGGRLELPENLKVIFSDNNNANKAVTWTNLDDVNVNEAGIYVVNGSITELGIPVSINVTVVENFGAILNYAAATPIGTPISLPDFRPGILDDGTVTDTQFKVTWDSIDNNIFNTEGIHVIKGMANVLGDNIPVVANIRVGNFEVNYESNVAALAASLTQSHEPSSNKVSDNISALSDGSTEYRAANTDDNPYVWSNYKATQQDNAKKTTLTYSYDTAKGIGQVVLHLFTDGWSARLPENVEMSWSRSATDFEKIELSEPKKELVKKYNNGVVLYKWTYTFPRVDAVSFKIGLTNTDEITRQQNNIKAIVALTEIELLSATSTFTPSSDATLAGIKINDTAATSSELENKVIKTEAHVAEISDVIGKPNVAYNILPIVNDEIKILTESEDHNSRELYTIKLKTPKEVSADSSDSDVDMATVEVSAGSEQKGEEAPRANDGNPGTLYHSAWAGADISKLWMLLEADEPTMIMGVRYLPRPNSTSSANGRLGGYKILAGLTEDNLVEVSSGTFENNEEWKLAKFEPVQAKYIKIQAVSTYGDRPNRYLSAAEARIVSAPITKNISDASITFEKDSYEYSGKEIKPKLTVTDGDKVLKEGVDYIIGLSENIQPGKASIEIKGIVKYSGVVNKHFNIILNKSILQDNTANSIVTESNIELNNDKKIIIDVADGEEKELTINNSVNHKFININAYEFIDGSKTKVTSPDGNIRLSFKLNQEFSDVNEIKMYRIDDSEYNEIETVFDKTSMTLSGTFNHFSSFVISGLLDYTNYNKALNDAESFISNSGKNYSSSSINEYNEAISIIKNEKENTKSITALNALVEKLNNLNSKLTLESNSSLDKSSLIKAIEKAKSVKEESKYYNDIESKKNILDGALSVAEALDEYSTQEAVNNATDNLKQAIEALNGLPTDTSILKALVDKTYESKKYTSASLKSLIEKIDAGKLLLNNDTATQEAVNEAIAQIKEAENNLVIHNIIELEKAIEAGEAIKNNSKYYNDSSEKISNLDEALEAAIAITEASNQNDIDTATNNLNKALSELSGEPTNKDDLSKSIREAEGWIKFKADEELNKALENSKSIFDDNSSTQIDTDKSNDELKAEIDKFKNSLSNKEKLKFEVELTKKFKEELKNQNINAATFIKLDNEIDSAENVIADVNSSQDKIVESIAKLKALREEIKTVENVDTSQLEDLIKVSKNKKNDYLYINGADDKKKALDKAITNAENYINQEVHSQAALDSNINELKIASEELDGIETDTTELEKVLKAATEAKETIRYINGSKISKDKLLEVLEKVNAVLKTEKPSQSIINTIKQELEVAMTSLDGKQSPEKAGAVVTNKATTKQYAKPANKNKVNANPVINPVQESISDQSKDAVEENSSEKAIESSKEKAVEPTVDKAAEATDNKTNEPSSKIEDNSTKSNGLYYGLGIIALLIILGGAWFIIAKKKNI